MIIGLLRVSLVTLPESEAMWSVGTRTLVVMMIERVKNFSGFEMAEVV